MFEDERVRRLEAEKEVLQEMLDAYDSILLETGKNLADTSAIFNEYGGNEFNVRAALSAHGRLGEEMEAAAKRGWRMNKRLEGVDVAGKKITAEMIREAFKNEDNPTSRWVKGLSDQKLREIADECSSPEAIRAAVDWLHGTE